MAQPLGSAFLLGQQGSQQYETLRKANWHVDISGIDSVLLAQSCNFPRYELDAVDVYHFNDRVKLASRPNPSDLSISLLDVVAPNIVQQLWGWFKEIYDPATGKMGLSSQYKRQGKVYLYLPDGTLIRTWTCQGLWPKNSPTPEDTLNYSDAHEPVRIAMTFSCDRASLDGQPAANLLA